MPDQETLSRKKVNQPLNWQQLTLQSCAKRSKQVSKRPQLITTALMAMRPGRGRILFLGAIGWVKELKIAGEYAASKLDRYVEAFDDYSNATSGSILDGPRAKSAKHIQTPPTIHGRVLLHDGWPDLSQDSMTIMLCCLAADNIEPLMSMRSELLNKAVLIGRHENLLSLSRGAGIRMLPFVQWTDWFAVKVYV